MSIRAVLTHFGGDSLGKKAPDNVGQMLQAEHRTVGASPSSPLGSLARDELSVSLEKKGVHGVEVTVVSAVGPATLPACC